KVLTILESIDNNQARIYDFKNEEYYQIELADDEVSIYQSMIDEADEEELADEETGVLVIFNTQNNKIDTADNESEMFKFMSKKTQQECSEELTEQMNNRI